MRHLAKRAVHSIGAGCVTEDRRLLSRLHLLAMAALILSTIVAGVAPVHAGPPEPLERTLAQLRGRTFEQIEAEWMKPMEWADGGRDTWGIWGYKDGKLIGYPGVVNLWWLAHVDRVYKWAVRIEFVDGVVVSHQVLKKWRSPDQEYYDQDRYRRTR